MLEASTKIDKRIWSFWNDLSICNLPLCQTSFDSDQCSVDNRTAFTVHCTSTVVHIEGIECNALVFEQTNLINFNGYVFDLVSNYVPFKSVYIHYEQRIRLTILHSPCDTWIRWFSFHRFVKWHNEKFILRVFHEAGNGACGRSTPIQHR